MEIENILFIKIEQLPKFLIYLSILLGIFFIFEIIRKWIIRKIENSNKEVKSILTISFVEVLKGLKPIPLMIIAFYISTLPLDLEESVRHALFIIFQIALIFQIILIIQSTIKIFFKHYEQHEENKDLVTMYNYLSKFLILIVWIIGILFFLSNIGYNTSSLIASLGVSSIAIALAVQGILTDIFSGFMILVNRPFQIGDYIKFPNDKNQSGTVEKIGLHNTTIRTINKEELIIPNNDIINSRLYNLRSREQRRFSFDVLVDLNTTSEDIEMITNEIYSILESHNELDIEKSRVKFSSYNEFAVVINVVITMKNDSFNTFVNTKEEINFEIKKLFESKNIKFAERKIQGAQEE